MTKEVRVHVYSLQKGPKTNEEPMEPMELITDGEYFYKNNKHYILYEETVEGETIRNKNRIKISPGHMELTKSGAVSTTMVFAKGEKNRTLYHTPYGSIAMDIATKSLQLWETEDAIGIEIAYGLYMEDEFVADCHIRIGVRSR